MVHRRATHSLSALAVCAALAACSGVPEEHALAAGDPLTESAVAASALSAAADHKSRLTHWSPGNYILLNSGAPSTAEVSERKGLLADAATMAPFVGLQIEYDWWLFEGAQGDYSAGFAAIDADLAAVANAGKKLVIFFQYKNFSGPNAVPTYLQESGPWCVSQAKGGSVCGQYQMSNGEIAMLWQGSSTGGTADRLHAWVQAVGAHVAEGAYASSVAGVVFPESACSQGNISFADVDYTQTSYLDGLEADVTAGGAAFPGTPIFQYINFLPGPDSQESYLADYAAWAQTHPFAGAGCPDLAPGGSAAGCGFDPPGYSVLLDASVQGTIPFNVAVEAADYGSCRTPSLKDTYDLGVLPASQGGMGAQYIAWVDHPHEGTGDVFDLPEVVTYLENAGSFPNTAKPTW
jgi:hypothetical protein